MLMSLIKIYVSSIYFYLLLLINDITSKSFNKINKFKAEYLQCKQDTMNDIQQEFLKRTYKPIYLPLIALMCGLIITRSKENNNYNKFNFFLFLLIFFILIISEISLRFSSGNQVGLLFFTLFPLLLFSALYTALIIKKKL